MAAEKSPKPDARVWFFRITISLMVMYLAWKTAAYYNERFLKKLVQFDLDAKDKKKKVERTDLVAFEMSNVVYYIILAVGIAFAVTLLGFTNSTVVAILGTAGLAFSLATQKFLTGVVSGVVVITNQLYKIGDYVKFVSGAQKMVEGRVINFNMLRTTVMTDAGEVVTIPNEEITGGQIYVDYGKN